MSIYSKIKKTALVAALAIVLAPSTALACNPLNPICLFQMLLKACPGLPVFDFVSVPAIIPHVPAALLKEAQTKMKETIDKKLEVTRSESTPSAVEVNELPSMDQANLAEGQEFASLEAFPSADSDDPLAVAKAIEVLYLRPGWQGGDKSPMTAYDKALMAYYRNQFQLNNIVEVVGFFTVVDSKMEELVAAAEKVQKQLDEADDLNKAQRANYEAQLLEYQLMIVYNQLLAAQMQMTSVSQLTGMKPVLDEPVLGKM